VCAVNNRRGKPAKRNSSKTSPDWLSLEDVFQRWRVRLGSSQEAVSELYDLLRDHESRSAKRRVDASGEEIPGTRGVVDPGFWPDHPCLSVVPDANGVGDRLGIDYTNYVDVYSLPDERTEFFVRVVDVERWERLDFPTAPALSKEPTPYKRYTTDDDLVVEGVNGVRSGVWSNSSQAAKALADRAEGSSHDSTVHRLRKKIGAALER
jgi:hypothetical protein